MWNGTTTPSYGNTTTEGWRYLTLERRYCAEELPITKVRVSILGLGKISMEGARPCNTKASIINLTIQANNFDIKPHIIAMLQKHYQFNGLSHEDSNEHLGRFLDLCATFKYNGVFDDVVRLRLFKFTLTGRAKTWLNTLPVGSIGTWVELQKKFLGKYFPPAMIVKLRNKITHFVQEPNEHLFEAWESFKGLLKRCPNHEIAIWMQIETFYNGLTVQTRSIIEAASGCSINKKKPQEVYDLIEEMTSNMYQYPIERTSKTVGGIYKLEPTTRIQAQIETPQRQVASLQQQPTPLVASICDMCGGGHSDYEYQGQLVKEQSVRQKGALPSNSEVNSRLQVQANSLRSGEILEDPKPKEMPAMGEEKIQPMEEEKEKESEKKEMRVTTPTSPKMKGKDFIPISDIDINIPIIEALKQMPKYGKFIKEVLSGKRKMEEQGIIADVLVKIGEFIFPCDFVVLDMEVDKNLPIILGKPFLATIGALIDVDKGKLTLRLKMKK
ncbi:hypothetical protein H6P81_017908 [Aristolochia fimbriata]|uniref:Retrotransposon gag domain-containing protein n=1 Tax=Aristolochia fimbriata TaxID=158543 RepID=A0AAV7DZX8_ARIFI|nr:hypothetical protein H6P81_017908 [Aristolochia fimbriata]